MTDVCFCNSTSESVSGPLVTLVVSFTWTKAFRNSVVLGLFNKFSSIFFLKTLPKVIHSVISLISKKKLLNQAWFQCSRPADFEKKLITLRRGSFSFNVNTFKILHLPKFIFWCKSKQISYNESLNEQTKRGSGFLFSSYSTFLTVSVHTPVLFLLDRETEVCIPSAKNGHFSVDHLVLKILLLDQFSETNRKTK